MNICNPLNISNFYLNILILITFYSYFLICKEKNKILTTCTAYGKYYNPFFFTSHALIITLLHYKMYIRENSNKKIIICSLILNYILFFICIMHFKFEKTIFLKYLHYGLSVIVFLLLLYVLYYTVLKNVYIKNIYAITIIFMLLLFLFVDNTKNRYVFNLIEIIVIFFSFIIIANY